jgi:hypothetical protein
MKYLMTLQGQASPPSDGVVSAYLKAVGSELFRAGVLLDEERVSGSGPSFTAGRDDGSVIRIPSSSAGPSDAGILAYWAVHASTNEEMEYWAAKFPPPVGTRLEVYALQ